MNGCFAEPALWPVADGQAVAADIARHLQACARCSAQVELLRTHRRQLRDVAVRQPRTEADGVERQLRAAGANGGEPHDRLRFNAAAADSLRPSRRPSRIGRYEVERLLARGGQAEVYLARHRSLTDRVVVKWALARLAEAPTVADQFAQEARLLSAIRHPNLPRVHDLGLAANRPFLVLEHIAGGTLAALRDRPRPFGQTAGMIAKVARALHAVHEFGRLHLDIQPDNILPGHDGEPRLIDFGMSQPRDAAARRSGCLVVQGTPEYMAPEQLAGDGSRIGVATDVYALGAVLHELLTGAPPQPELVWEHAAFRSTARHTSSADIRVARIFRSALHPDPTRRFRSAGEFANELERCTRAPQKSRLVIAGLILATSAAVWDRPPVRPAAEAHVVPSRQRLLSSTVQRRELIAAAVQQLLAEARTRNWTPSIILADGRSVPVLARPGAASESTPAFAHIIAAQLEEQHGTTLLLVAAQPVSFCGPQLSNGTIASLTERRVAVLAPPVAADQGLHDVLCGLQHRLRASNPEYRALVLSSGRAAIDRDRAD